MVNVEFPANCVMGSFTEQAFVLLLDALIHKKQDIVRFCQFLCFRIDDAKLQPNSPGFELDSLFDNRKELFRSHKYIDDINLFRYPG